MEKDGELLPNFDTVEKVQKEIYKRNTAMQALEDIHNACDEICAIAERRVEWGLTDYTDLRTGLTAKHILLEAALKVRMIANQSVKDEFPDLDIDMDGQDIDINEEVDKLLGRNYAR